MMTICAPDRDSLIIPYEHFGGSGGEMIHILWVSASNYVDRDQIPFKEQSNLGTQAKRYVSIGEFSCAF